MASRRIWQCKVQHPKRQFSVKVGTIFEDSPIGLDKWFAVIWMLANDKNGISSYGVARSVGVTQKTAWFMLDRIRLAMQTGTFNKLLGTVEVDETFIGGKTRYQHENKKKQIGTGGMGKVAVMGLLERHGEFQYRILESRRRHHVDVEVRNVVESGSHVYTESLRSYDKLSDIYTHKVIDHAEAYVEGRVHTTA